MKNQIIKVDITLAFKKIRKDIPISQNVYSRLIGWKTKSNYSHVEVIINNNWISSVETKGVHVKPLKPLKDEYEYVSLTVEVTEQQHLDNMTWIYKQDKKPYDTYGIVFTQILPLRFESRDKWYCSELTTKILQLYSVQEVIDLYPQTTSPGILAKTFNIES